MLASSPDQLVDPHEPEYRISGFAPCRTDFKVELSINGTGGSTNVNAREGHTYIREYI